MFKIVITNSLFFSSIKFLGPFPNLDFVSSEHTLNGLAVVLETALDFVLSNAGLI